MTFKSFFSSKTASTVAVLDASTVFGNPPWRCPRFQLPSPLYSQRRAGWAAGSSEESGLGSWKRGHRQRSVVSS
jgi:hypothetical protein